MVLIKKGVNYECDIYFKKRRVFICIQRKSKKMSKETDELRRVTNLHCFRGTTATQMIESNFDITFKGFQTPVSNFSSFEKREKGKNKYLKIFRNKHEIICINVELL